MPDEAEPQPWHRLYWDAWEAIRFDRQYGAMGGETPITYSVISRYAQDHDIVGNDFRIFHKLMTAIDAEWLNYQAEKQKGAEQNGG